MVKNEVFIPLYGRRNTGRLYFYGKTKKLCCFWKGNYQTLPGGAGKRVAVFNLEPVQNHGL
jgi:hypothetical protein